MLKYVLRRLLWSVVVLLAAASFTFTLVHIVPADPARTIAGQRASDELLASVKRELALDQPLYVQYWLFLKRAAQLDFGRSYRTRERVVEAITQRLPATFQLALGAMLVQLAVGIPIGILTAIRRKSLLDSSGRIVTVLLLSMPTFWLGMMLLYLFAFKIYLFPLGGYEARGSVILPSLALGLGGAAFYARLLRADLIEILNQDYIRAAYAKGLSQRSVLLRHAMRGALIPIVTLIGLDMGAFLGGIVITERVFNWPGMGSLVVSAVLNVDTPLIMGTVLFSAAAVVVMNFLVDISYLFIDPRIRLSE